MAEARIFEPAAFVRDFNEAGCTIELMDPNAEGLQGFCIKSGRGYGATMMRWADILDQTPDFYEQVVAYLQQEASHDDA